MEKPYVRKEVKEPPFFLAGFQVEGLCPDCVWTENHRRAVSRTSDQRFTSGDLEGPVLRTRRSDLWPECYGQGSDFCAGAGDWSTAYGVGHFKKSVQEAPLVERIRISRDLGRVYPVRRVCLLLGVPRSTVLYKGRSRVDLQRLSSLIEHNRVTFPTFGATLMYHLLVRQRAACTRANVRQVYLQLGILGRRAPARSRTTDSRHEHERYPNIVKELLVNRPNQVWVADTLELFIGGRKAFLALVEDMYTRRVMGLALSFSNNALLTREALEMSLLKGTPEIHHSDQGKP